jgi:8-oxo-dGTP pyrophosphatase MutT (NUDIX family)
MTTNLTARLAEFLAIRDTAQNLPGVRIRDAATMLIIDRSGPVSKVLFGRRHHGHKFMPGQFVFPGGRVERGDRHMRAATALDVRVEARLMKELRHPSAGKARGFPLAAIRETFEETGLVLGVRPSAPSPPVGEGRGGGSRNGARPRLNSSTPTPDPSPAEPRYSEGSATHESDPSRQQPTWIGGGEKRHGLPKPQDRGPPSEAWASYAEAGAVPDLAAVHFIARSITPPGRPRRFDTRFFAVDADAIAARIDGVVSADTELVELVWLPIEDAAKLDMPAITMAVVEELKIRTASGFKHDLPVPFYRTQRGKRLREFL